MSRARTEVFDPMMEVEKPSRCMRFLRLLWKFSRCVFSHVTLISLVVAYCLIGAYAFEALEANHEKEVKKSIKNIRGNVSEKLWEITKDFEVLIRDNWTEKALKELKEFENSLLIKMSKEGWDGNEEETNIQWTFAGALFYSIIVITTIGSRLHCDLQAMQYTTHAWVDPLGYILRPVPLLRARPSFDLGKPGSSTGKGRKPLPRPLRPPSLKSRRMA